MELLYLHTNGKCLWFNELSINNETYFHPRIMSLGRLCISLYRTTQLFLNAYMEQQCTARTHTELYYSRQRLEPPFKAQQ
jgi:hypothetical protein